MLWTITSQFKYTRNNLAKKTKAHFVWLKILDFYILAAHQHVKIMVAFPNYKNTPDLKQITKLYTREREWKKP